MASSLSPTSLTPALKMCRRYKVGTLSGLSILALIHFCRADNLQTDKTGELTVDTVSPPNHVPTANLERVTLEQSLKIATQDNPSLKAAFARWRGSLEKVIQARALPDPKLNYEILTQVETPEHRFGVKQELPQFGMLKAETDMAMQEAKAKQQMFLAEKLALFAEVKTAFYECEYLSKAIATEETSIQLMRDMDSGMRIRYVSSQESHTNLLRLQAEIGKMEAELKSMQSMIPLVAARLNSALGRDPSGVPFWPEPQALTVESEALSAKDLLSALDENSPEIQASREMVMAAEAQRGKAKAGYWPMVMVGVRQMRSEGGPPMGESNYPVEAMIEFSLPLNFRKNRAAVREAEAMMEASQSEKIALRHKLALDLKENFYYYQDALRRLGLAENTLIPKQEEALQSMRRTFGSGKAEYIDVVDAQRNLLAFRLMAERARADIKIRLSILERISARSLRRGGSS